jgi:hypothetical protein
MRQVSLSILTGYVVAAFATGLGIAVLTRLLDLNVQPTARYIFGAVLLLMGIYRFTITWVQARAGAQRRKLEDEERKTRDEIRNR